MNVEYKVLLLKNILVQYKIVNGSIRTIKEILFNHMDEPCHIPDKQPVCVIVEFKQSTIAEELKWRIHLDKICIPIIPVIIHFEEKNRIITSIVSRICTYIMIYKSKSMSIGLKNPFESVIVYHLEKGE